MNQNRHTELTKGKPVHWTNSEGKGRDNGDRMGDGRDLRRIRVSSTQIRRIRAENGKESWWPEKAGGGRVKGEGLRYKIKWLDGHTTT